MPGGPVVKDPPIQGHRFDSWSREILHVAKQLSPLTATEPECLDPVLHKERSHRNEKPADHN